MLFKKLGISDDKTLTPSNINYGLVTSACLVTLNGVDKKLKQKFYFQQNTMWAQDCQLLEKGTPAYDHVFAKRTF